MFKFYQFKKKQIKNSMNQNPITMFLIFFIIRIQNANLICNGDFQGHALTSTYLNEKYVFQNSNFTCWYNKNKNQVQFKQKLFPPVTSVVELVSVTPYVLCQNVTLEVGLVYNLSFDAVNSWTMNYSTIIVTINSFWVMNLTTLNSLNVSSGWTQLQANAVSNMLCFDSVFYIQNASQYNFIGPALDNVTLVKIDKPNKTSIVNISNNPIPVSTIEQISQTIYIYCSSSLDDQNLNAIYFTCNYSRIQILYQFLKFYNTSLQIYFEGELQKNVYVLKTQASYMKALVYPERAYNLQNVSFNIPPGFIADCILKVKFKVFLNGGMIVFSFLNTAQQEIIKIISPISENIMNALQNAYQILRVSLFGYFLMDIINFWNLSLMYNFMDIKTIPSFARNVFQQMQSLLFKLDSITALVGQKYPEIQQNLNVNSTFQELMKQFRNGHAWFGYFGMSSNFISNNMQQVLLFGVLCLKILILFLLGKVSILPRFFKKRIPQGINLAHMLLYDTIGLQIFMVLSAATVQLSPGVEEFIQKVNSTGQILIYCTCLLIIPLFLLVSIELEEEKTVKTKVKKFSNRLGLQSSDHKAIYLQKSALIKKIKRRIMITTMNSILQIVTYITIPSLIILQKPEPFLFVNFFLIGARFYWFFRYLSTFYYNKRQKIFSGLSVVVWVVHNLAYIAMWAVQKVIQNGNLDLQSQQKIQYTLKILGYVVIFTVLTGGVFEIVDFCLNLLISVISFLYRKIRKCFRKQNKKILEQPRKSIELDKKKFIKVQPCVNFNNQLQGQNIKKKGNERIQFVNFHITKQKKSSQIKVQVRKYQLKQNSIRPKKYYQTETTQQ